MSRLKKKAGRASAQTLVGVHPTSDAEVPAFDVSAARVGIAGTSPPDQVGGGKEKFLEQVVTPNSKKKPPLPKHRKRKHPLDEAEKQIRRRQGSSPPRPSARRLEPVDSNNGVHIHVNLDNSSQVQSRSPALRRLPSLCLQGKCKGGRGGPWRCQLLHKWPLTKSVLDWTKMKRQPSPKVAHKKIGMVLVNQALLRISFN